MYPSGPIQTKWHTEGYQSALRDIAEKLEQGGAEAVQEWLDNNMRKQEGN